MIIAPRRSASAPLPPILLVPRKIGGALRPLSLCAMCIPRSQSPPRPPLAPVRPCPFAEASGHSRPDSSLPPPAPGGGYITMQTRSAKIPIPTPAPCSLRSLPPLPLPAGGFNYICYTMAIPSHVPTHPPLAPARPRPSRLGARVGPSDRSLPPAPPRGALITSSIPWKPLLRVRSRLPPHAIAFMLRSRYHLQKPERAPASADARSSGATWAHAVLQY